jgi:microcystin-dependent protein
VLGNSGGTQNPGSPFDVALYSSANPNTTLAPGVIGNSGASQPHENRMPSLVVNMCIALQGVFPARD